MVQQFSLLTSVFSKEFLHQVMYCVHEQQFGRGELLFEENKPILQEDKCLYFLNQGQVQLQSIQTNTTMSVLGKSEIFGQIEFFSSQQYRVSARTTDFSTVLHIKRCDFERIAYNCINEHDLELLK